MLTPGTPGRFKYELKDELRADLEANTRAVKSELDRIVDVLVSPLEVPCRQGTLLLPFLFAHALTQARMALLCLNSTAAAR